MIGKRDCITAGFKELIIREQIADVCGEKNLLLADSTPIEKIGLNQRQVAEVIMKCSKALEQEPVVNPASVRPQTIGDIVFYFYSAAERYKYFEQIILSGVHQAGNFLKQSVKSDEVLKESIFRDDAEKKAVFDRIQNATGRSYLAAYQIAESKYKMETAQDFIRLLSNPENGVLMYKLAQQKSSWFSRAKSKQQEKE